MTVSAWVVVVALILLLFLFSFLWPDDKIAVYLKQNRQNGMDEESFRPVCD